MARANQVGRTVRLSLAADTSAAGESRQFVRSHLRGAVERDIIDVVELLTSELVTNAVVHTGVPRVLVLVLAPDHVRVEVEDGSSRPPVLVQSLPATSLTGRGIRIVEALSTRWGVEPVAKGKRVWFEVAW
ncbi:MAG: ATP-binding protein [Acidimicrobiales bacterium]